MQLYWSDLNYKYEKALQHSRRRVHVCLSVLQLFHPPSKELSTTAHLTKISGDRFAIGIKEQSASPYQVLTAY